MNIASNIEVLDAYMREVRAKTIKLLDKATEDELLWSPPGLANHVLWHAGHVVWVQDWLAVEAATGTSQMPSTWAETFGNQGRSPAETTNWPSRASVMQELTSQIDRLTDLYQQLTPAQLDGPPKIDRLAGTGKPLAYWIIHATHDEANHQGEMHLLLKMQRAGK